jgi:riboflavin synthase
MFTGIVEARAPVKRVERRESGLRAWIAGPDGFDAALGQSIAVSGACLTVAGFADPASGASLPMSRPGADLVFDLSAETLERTWLGDVRVGRQVNLERALRLGDRLDGHLVSGHVDGRARIAKIGDARDRGVRMELEAEPGFERYLVDKGSVTIDGVSLTVVAPRQRKFAVALIPLTLERTTLGSAEVDQLVNLEVDMIAKWIERLMPPR